MRKPRRAISIRLLICGALAGTLASSAALSSQPRPPVSAPEEPIVVTGERLTREQARERAVAFVRGTGVAAGDRPVARWVDPVCMNVIGVSPDHARIVRARIERIARAAGVPIAGGNCQNNFAVIFATDANSVVRDVERRAPRRLSEVTGDDRARLLDSAMPIRWWYSTQPRSRHGVRQSTNSPAWTAGMPTTDGAGTNSAPSGGGSVLPDNVPNLYQYNSSIISTQAVRALVSASVVIDVNQMRMPLEAVAAYVAMVGFAEIRQNDFTSTASILGMFEDEPSAARALTDWDLAFLRVLYRLPLDRDARRHRGILVRDLVAAVDSGVSVDN